MLRLQLGRRVFILLVVVAGLWETVPEAHAIPLYARRHNLRCNACHVIPPKLNANGQAYWNRGYRLPPELADKQFETIPLAVWITGRQEEQVSKDFSEGFLSKVELLSGGPIGESFSYFIEWRIGSLQTREDGSLRDRGGRFEDAFVNWSITDRSTITVGQYRAINQVDVSLRLSVSEPALFSTSLAGEPSSDPRITSLRAFSPSGRSPGITYSYQSILCDSPSDGLFHFVTVPFVGELSIPLTQEAHDEASFELEGPAKGVFLETFYRQGLNSVGVHAFIDDDRWLLSGVGVLNIDDFYLTAGIGVDDRDDASERIRSSLEVEYLYTCTREDWLRPGVGFRVEHVGNSDREPAYIPYVVLSGPNEDYTFLSQIQYRFQEDNSAFFFDLSVIF